MFNSHVTPTHWSRRIASASSENVNAFFHSPTRHRHHAVGETGKRDRVRVADALRQVPLTAGRVSDGACDRSDRLHATTDSIAIARDRRHGSPASSAISRWRALNATALDHVDEQQSGRRRPARVQTEERIGVDVVDMPRHEVQTAPPEPGASPQQRQQRGAGTAGHAPCPCSRHRANEVQAAIDVPADQELFGAAALQFDSLKVDLLLPPPQVGLGGFGWPAGIGQRGGKSFPPRAGRWTNPVPAPARAGKRTRLDRRRARRPPSRRPDRPESPRSRSLRRPDNARTAPRSRRFASLHAAPAPCGRESAAGRRQRWPR